MNGCIVGCNGVAAQWFKIRNTYAAQYEAQQTAEAAFEGYYVDNMQHRSVTGTTGWSLYEIVMDVDSVHFLPVPVGTRSTTVYGENQLKPEQGYTPPSIVQSAPANVDFERVPGT